jgi:hypothetical protein
MSYTIIRGRWCVIIVVKVYAPTEAKIVDVRDSVCGELVRVFDKFPKYNMKILSGYFSPKVSRENIFKPTIGNENLHKISNYCQKDNVPTS